MREQINEWNLSPGGGFGGEFAFEDFEGMVDCLLIVDCFLFVGLVSKSIWDCWLFVIELRIFTELLFEV